MAALRPSTQQKVSKYSPPLQLAGEASNGPPTDGFVVAAPNLPPTRLTQDDQDKADEQKQQESMRTLIQTWMDSLQLISVITTFFVATEASFLVIIIPSRSDPGLSAAGQLANIGLTCALVVHAHAAIISFLGAFYLIRYKLDVAEKAEEEAEKQLIDSPISLASKFDPEKAPRGSQTSPHANNLRTDPVRRGRVRVNSPLSGNQIIWSTNPHLVQIGPFQGQAPTQLLARCHSLCIFLAFVGFILTLIGAMSFAWDRLPLSVSIFPTISASLCLVAALLILIVPSTKTSHIYYDPSRSRQSRMH